MEWLWAALAVFSSLAASTGTYFWGRERGIDIGRRRQYESDAAERQRMMAEVQAALQVADAERATRVRGVSKTAADWMDKWR